MTRLILTGLLILIPTVGMAQVDSSKVVNTSEGELKIVKLEPTANSDIFNRVFLKEKEIYADENSFLYLHTYYDYAGVVLLQSHDSPTGRAMFYRAVLLRDRKAKKPKVYELGHGKVPVITYNIGTIRFVFPKGKVLGEPVAAQTWIINYEVAGEASIRRIGH